MGPQADAEQLPVQHLVSRVTPRAIQTTADCKWKDSEPAKHRSPEGLIWKHGKWQPVQPQDAGQDCKAARMLHAWLPPMDGSI